MTRIETEDLSKEEELEDRLTRAETAQIGGVELFYVARQGSYNNEITFDILSVDKAGNTVIVELKRDDAPRKVVAQALDYASKIINAEYAYLDREYESFLREEQGYDEDGDDDFMSLREAHAAHFGLDEPLSASEFNNEQRMIIIADEYSDDRLLNMMDFLREHGIDVIAVKYTKFRDDKQDVDILATDAIRRPLNKEPTNSVSENQGPREWEIDGEGWHLEKRTHENTGNILRELVEELQKVESLQSPQWGQRRYIAFADETGERRFVIMSQKTQMKIILHIDTPNKDVKERIAKNTGIPQSELSEIYDDNVQRTRFQIRCKPEHDPDIEAIKSEITRLLFDTEE